MSFSCERTGFPLVYLPGRDLHVHLLPVAKIQFERFLAEPNEFDDQWYEEVLEVSPRVSVGRCSDERRERLFLTGVTPDEAGAFARWLGPEWSVPSVELWRHVYLALAQTPFKPEHLDMWTRPPIDPAAARLVEQLVRSIAPSTLLDISLMNSGVLEWVREEKEYGALGSPRPQFAQILVDPLRSPPLRPIRPNARLPYVGFRLVRVASQTAASRPAGNGTVWPPRRTA